LNKEQVIRDTPSNSLKDSYVSLKVKTTDKKKVVIHSSIHNTSGVRGVCWSFGMKTTLSFRHSKKCMPFTPRWVTNKSIIHLDLYKLNNKLVSALLKHFWCTNEPWAYIDSQISPRAWTWVEATTFPFTIFFMINHRACTQMWFFSQLPSRKSWNFRNLNSHHFGGLWFLVQTSD
jgi:hypothetical protein